MNDELFGAATDGPEAAVDGEVISPGSDGHGLAVADDMLPSTLHIMPISTRPYFPGQAQPVTVNMEQWADTLREVAKSGHRLLGLAFVDGKEAAQATTDEFPVMGCVVRLHRIPNAGENQGQFLVQGIKRFRVVRWLNEQAPFLAQVEYPRSQGQRESDEVKAYAMALIKEVKELLPLNPLYSEELKQYLSHFSPNQPSFLADFCAAENVQSVSVRVCLATSDLRDYVIFVEIIVVT